MHSRPRACVRVLLGLLLACGLALVSALDTHLARHDLGVENNMDEVASAPLNPDEEDLGSSIDVDEEASNVVVPAK